MVSFSQRGYPFPRPLRGQSCQYAICRNLAGAPAKDVGVVDSKVEGLAILVLLLDELYISEPDSLTFLDQGAVDGEELQSHLI